MELNRGAVLTGEFIVEAPLARDANTVVFVARQPSQDRLVTIKLFLTGESGQRFLVTYARASQIKSEFIPKLLDLGTLPDGRSYIVREYIEGEDLHAVVSRGVLTSMEAVQFVLQACEAVAATHVVGVVHGTLKTSSLVVTQLPSGAPIVKVLNCGLGRILRPDAQNITACRAPEQLIEGGKVDGRCDVWAIGAILYELLAAEPPFTGSTAKSLMKRIIHEPPRPLRKIRPDVPEPLAAVVHRCLEKAPDSRWSTIAELATALGPFGSVRTIALPMRISQLKIPASMSSSTGPVSTRSEASMSAALASAATPRPSSPLPLQSIQMFGGGGGEEEAALRKMTSEGRIERLDANAAALVVREKRVAAEADNLARDARVNPRAALPEEDTGMKVLDQGGPEPMPPAPTMTQASGASFGRWGLRHPVVLILLVALGSGLLVGIAIRVMANRPHPERRKPREIIVEDRPNGDPVKRSVP